MYVYNYRIFDKYNKEVASFAVLGDDNPDWRPDHFGYRRWGTEAGTPLPDRQAAGLCGKTVGIGGKPESVRHGGPGALGYPRNPPSLQASGRTGSIG